MKKSVFAIISFLMVVTLLNISGCSKTTTSNTTTKVTTTATSMTTTTTTTTQSNIQIPPTGPTVTIMNPGYGDAGQPVNSSITATFSEAVTPSTINQNTFTLWQGTTPVAGGVSYDGQTAVLNPANDLAKDTEYTAKITTDVTDLSGVHMQNDFVWSFTTGEIDTVAPMVSSTIPSFTELITQDPNNPFASSTNVPVNNAITATFSEGMDPSTINNNTFTLMQGTTAVAGTVTFDGDRTATFTPAATLSPNTDYTAAITTGAICLGGNGLAQNFVWGFSTGPAQTTIPTVVSSIPAGDDTNVPVNTSITVNFSEAVNAMTINTNTFMLMSGTTPVPGTVSFDGVHTAVFDPINDLTVGGTYTVNITTDVTDLAGIHMANPVTWSFTTGAIDTVPPTVLSTTPADGDQGVATNSTITVTFSEAIDPTNIGFNLQQGTTIVPYTMTYNDSLTVVTITPAAALSSNTTYTAAISASDLQGFGPANKSWNFTTGP